MNEPRTPSPAGPATAPASTQPRDLLGRVAERRQHRLGVLPQRRTGRAPRVARRARELDRHAEQPHRALGAGLVDLHDHLARAHELGVERLVEAEHRLEAAVVLARERGPLVARAAREDRLDLALGLRAARVELALDQVLAPDAAAERLPELRLERAERHPAVGAAVGPVTDEPARQLELPALRRGALGQRARGDHRQPRQRAVGHRDVDELALAGAVALAQRDEDPDRGHQRAAAEVGDLARRLHGRRRRARRSGRAARRARGSSCRGRSGRGTGRPARSR